MSYPEDDDAWLSSYGAFEDFAKPDSPPPGGGLYHDPSLSNIPLSDDLAPSPSRDLHDPFNNNLTVPLGEYQYGGDQLRSLTPDGYQQMQTLTSQGYDQHMQSGSNMMMQDSYNSFEQPTVVQQQAMDPFAELDSLDAPSTSYYHTSSPSTSQHPPQMIGGGMQPQMMNVNVQQHQNIQLQQHQMINNQMPSTSYENVQSQPLQHQPQHSQQGHMQSQQMQQIQQSQPGPSTSNNRRPNQSRTANNRKKQNSANSVGAVLTKANRYLQENTGAGVQEARLTLEEANRTGEILANLMMLRKQQEEMKIDHSAEITRLEAEFSAIFARSLLLNTDSVNKDVLTEVQKLSEPTPQQQQQMPQMIQLQQQPMQLQHVQQMQQPIQLQMQQQPQQMMQQQAPPPPQKPPPARKAAQRKSKSNAQNQNNANVIVSTTTDATGYQPNVIYQTTSGQQAIPSTSTATFIEYQGQVVQQTQQSQQVQPTQVTARTHVYRGQAAVSFSQNGQQIQLQHQPTQIVQTATHLQIQASNNAGTPQTIYVHGAPGQSLGDVVRQQQHQLRFQNGSKNQPVATSSAQNTYIPSPSPTTSQMTSQSHSPALRQQLLGSTPSPSSSTMSSLSQQPTNGTPVLIAQQHPQVYQQNSYQQSQPQPQPAVRRIVGTVATTSNSEPQPQRIVVNETNNHIFQGFPTGTVLQVVSRAAPQIAAPQQPPPRMQRPPIPPQAVLAPVPPQPLPPPPPPKQVIIIEKPSLEEQQRAIEEKVEERRQRLSAFFAQSAASLENPQTETPFSDMRDVLQRLLPFALHSEPDLRQDEFDDFDDNYLRKSINLSNQVSGMRQRLWKVMLDESMKTSEKSEENMLAHLEFEYEKRRFEEEKTLLKENPEAIASFVVKSDVLNAVQKGILKVEPTTPPKPASKSTNAKNISMFHNQFEYHPFDETPRIFSPYRSPSPKPIHTSEPSTSSRETSPFRSPSSNRSSLRSRQSSLSSLAHSTPAPPKKRNISTSRDLKPTVEKRALEERQPNFLLHKDSSRTPVVPVLAAATSRPSLAKTPLNDVERKPLNHPKVAPKQSPALPAKAQSLKENQKTSNFSSEIASNKPSKTVFRENEKKPAVPTPPAKTPQARQRTISNSSKSRLQGPQETPKIIPEKLPMNAENRLEVESSVGQPEKKQSFAQVKEVPVALKTPPVQNVPIRQRLASNSEEKTKTSLSMHKMSSRDIESDGSASPELGMDDPLDLLISEPVNSRSALTSPQKPKEEKNIKPIPKIIIKPMKPLDRNSEEKKTIGDVIRCQTPVQKPGNAAKIVISLPASVLSDSKQKKLDQPTSLMFSSPKIIIPKMEQADKPAPRRLKIKFGGELIAQKDISKEGLSKEEPEVAEPFVEKRHKHKKDKKKKKKSHKQHRRVGDKIEKRKKKKKKHRMEKEKRQELLKKIPVAVKTVENPVAVAPSEQPVLRRNGIINESKVVVTAVDNKFKIRFPSSLAKVASALPNPRKRPLPNGEHRNPSTLQKPATMKFKKLTFRFRLGHGAEEVATRVVYPEDLSKGDPKVNQAKEPKKFEEKRKEPSSAPGSSEKKKERHIDISDLPSTSTKIVERHLVPPIRISKVDKPREEKKMDAASLNISLTRSPTTSHFLPSEKTPRKQKSPMPKRPPPLLPWMPVDNTTPVKPVIEDNLSFLKQGGLDRKPIKLEPTIIAEFTASLSSLPPRNAAIPKLEPPPEQPSSPPLRASSSMSLFLDDERSNGGIQFPFLRSPPPANKDPLPAIEFSDDEMEDIRHKELHKATDIMRGITMSSLQSGTSEPSLNNHVASTPTLPWTRF